MFSQILLLILCLSVSAASPLALGQLQLKQYTKPVPISTPQEVSLLFAGVTTNNRILLTLNNNHAHQLTVSLTSFSSSGRSTKLPSILLISNESKLLELSPILQAAGLDGQDLGWLQVTYEGAFLGLGVQLTLYPGNGLTGVDSPRTVNKDYTSGVRDAVFWLPPSGKATVSLVNTSSSVITIGLDCAGNNEMLQLQPKAQFRKLITSANFTMPNTKGIAVSCDMRTYDDVSSLRAIGLVEGPGGYAAPIRFYDTATSTTPDITAVGIHTDATTFLTLHNVTDDPVVVFPKLYSISSLDDHKEELSGIHLRPHAVSSIDINSALSVFQRNTRSAVTVTLSSRAPKGAVIGALTQVGSADGIVEDIPLRTSYPAAYARGAYPLRWDSDYTNEVTLANTTSSVLTAKAYITSGGSVYVLPSYDIEPGQSIAYDVDSIRRSGIPDTNGEILSRSATYGKFFWYEAGMGTRTGLMGRNSVYSKRNRRRSSFSCPTDCSGSQESYPYYDLDPFSFLMAGMQQTSGITSHYIDGGGNPAVSPYQYLQGSIWTNDSSIFNFAANSGNGNSYLASTGLVGSTGAGYTFDQIDAYYDGDRNQCITTDSQSTPSGSSGTNPDETPILTGVDPSDWTSGTTIPGVVFTGQYFGTNPPTLTLSPNSGISYSVTNSSDTFIQADVTVAQGVPNEDISITITNNGYGGSAFASGGGATSPMGDPVNATVYAPFNSPDITVIGWVDRTSADLAPPNLAMLKKAANNTLTGQLDGLVSCFVEVGYWAFNGTATDLHNQADRDYANVFLVANSANNDPGMTLPNPKATYDHGDYRTFHEWGNSTGRSNIGKTPDPCGSLGTIIDGIAGAADASKHYMNHTGTSASGLTYQIVEGQVGKHGRDGNRVINGRETPWVWSVIEFDSAGTPTTSDHATFPTYSVYQNGNRIAVYPQSDVKSFIYQAPLNEDAWTPIP